MFAQAIVYGGEETGPEPCVVFGREVGRVVWKCLRRRTCDEDFGWVLVEDGEELWTRVGREGDVWN